MAEKFRLVNLLYSCLFMLKTSDWAGNLTVNSFKREDYDKYYMREGTKTG